MINCKNVQGVISGLIIFLLSNTVQAQYLPLSIPVIKNGQNLRNPWAGGLDAPQFSTLDLNNDGLKDLLVFDRLTEVSTTFINKGTANQVDYDFAPRYHTLLPQQSMKNFLLCRDFNGDGISDLIGMHEIYGIGSRVAVWKGYRNADDSIRFELFVNELTYDDSPRGGWASQELFVYRTDVPGIADVDGDGDLDMFSFPNSFRFGTNITFYENRAVDNGHGLDTLEFYLGSDCWGLMSEELDSAKVYFSPSPDSCYNNVYYNSLMAAPDQSHQTLGNLDAARNSRHTGTNITLLDYNGDNHTDLVLSEINFKNANLLTGTTVNDTAWMRTQQPQFPIYDKPVDIYSFPSVYFLDVNNDGIDDMLAAPSDVTDGQSVNDSVAWYYQNIGSNANMIFSFQQKDFLVGEMIDVGRNTHPVVVDVTGDSLMDIVIGGYGRCLEDGQMKYGLTLLVNIGTATAPAFEWRTDRFAGTDSLRVLNLHPTFGDLDGDGDLDMICGNEQGTLIFFENIAGVNQAIRFNAPVRNYAGIDVLSRSAPQLVDLNRDGALDLAIGNNAGRLYYHENTGTALVPSFSTTALSNELGNYFTQFPNLRSAIPYFYDNQGNYELILSQSNGNFIHLDSIDNNILGHYVVRSEDYKGIYRGNSAQMSITDINNDGKKEYLIGTGAGGLMFMSEVDSFVSTTTLHTQASQIRLYPNPAQELVTVDYQVPLEEEAQLIVYNSLGQVLLQQRWQRGNTQEQLSLKHLPAGLLWIKLEGRTVQETLRLIKQ